MFKKKKSLNSFKFFLGKVCIEFVFPEIECSYFYRIFLNLKTKFFFYNFSEIRFSQTLCI